MGYSTLISKVIPAISKKGRVKWSSRKGHKVSRVIVHHWAGTRGGVERLCYSEDSASVNYIILSTGEIIGSVDEDFRAWTSGSFDADSKAITIEVQNSTLAPNWEVSQAAYNSLVKLIKDIHTRHKLTPSRKSVMGHREWQATSCPGPFLYPKLEKIVEEIKNGSVKPTPTKPVTVKPTPTVKPTTTKKPSVLRVNYKYSSDVKKLQAGLNKVFPSYRNSSRIPRNTRGKLLVVDGIFGKTTEAWVKEFQARVKITIDGIVGPVTIKKLAEYGVRI